MMGRHPSQLEFLRAIAASFKRRMFALVLILATLFLVCEPLQEIPFKKDSKTGAYETTRIYDSIKAHYAPLWSEPLREQNVGGSNSATGWQSLERAMQLINLTFGAVPRAVEYLEDVERRLNKSRHDREIAARRGEIDLPLQFNQIADATTINRMRILPRESTRSSVKYIIAVGSLAAIVALFAPQLVIYLGLVIFSATLFLGLFSAAWSAYSIGQISSVFFLIGALIVFELACRLGFLFFSYVNRDARTLKDRVDAAFKPLVSQKKTVDDVLRSSGLTGTAEPSTGAIIVALDGPWGSGKTTVTDWVEIRAHCMKDVIPVRLNAWTFEGEQSMETALITRLTMDWQVAKSGGWLAVPVLW